MHRFLAVAIAIALVGCASTSDKSGTTSSAQSPREEKEYRVGSRIPVRDPSAVSASPTGSVDPSTLRTGAPVRTN
jgi:outer membrane lipoprotein SlyB